MGWGDPWDVFRCDGAVEVGGGGGDTWTRRGSHIKDATSYENTWPTSPNAVVSLIASPVRSNDPESIPAEHS